MDFEDNHREPASRSLGSEAAIRFASFDGKEVKGKVDTGATTSSMHAVSIQPKGNQVSFVCPYISNNVITMDMEGAQDVLSADGGNNKRPMVKYDISIDGVDLPGMVFNLNDRGEMDCPILIGQNIIKSGNFIIDLNKDGGEQEQSPMGESVVVEEDKETKRTQDVMSAIKILKDNNVTIFELVEFLRTAPVYLRHGGHPEDDD